MKTQVSKNPMDYPNNGLSHPISHLNSIKNQIHTFPIEKQAEYADAICKAMVSNHERTDGDDIYQIVEDIKKNPAIAKSIFERFNTTAIGNTAYVAMNSSSVDEVKISMEMLDLFKKYKTGKL